MIKSLIKIFLVLTFITTFLGCKEYPTQRRNNIMFLKSKVFISEEGREELRKVGGDFDRFEEIFNSFPVETQIVIMDEDGKNQRIVVKKRAKIGTLNVGYPMWFPDGKKILFFLRKGLEKKIEMWSVNVKGTNLTKLMEWAEDEYSGCVSFSPDGKKIAMSLKERDKYKIYIMDIDGKNRVKISNTSRDDVLLGWSPDGKKIVFVAEEIRKWKEFQGKEEECDFYMVDVDGKNLKKLNNNNKKEKIRFYQDCWSPNGEKIVYTAFCDDNYEIFVMDKNGNNRQRLTYNSVDDVAPEWSPDGKKIAYTSDHILWLMNPDGNNQVKLTDNTQIYVTYGIWSPDGKKIALMTNDDIYTIDIDGKNLKNLTNTPDWDERFFSWQPMMVKDE